MKKRMMMSMRMSESQGEEDEGEHELQHEYERRIRVAPMAANQLAACLCVCEPVLQVIAHDAVLLWPDGPKRASRSTKKHSALAAQRDRMGPKTRAGARKNIQPLPLSATCTHCAASRAAPRVWAKSGGYLGITSLVGPTRIPLMQDHNAPDCASFFLGGFKVPSSFRAWDVCSNFLKFTLYITLLYITPQMEAAFGQPFLFQIFHARSRSS